MESSFIGIVVLVVIAGFVAYKFLGNKDSESSSGGGSVSEPAPAVKVSKLPSKAELSKMTKKSIDELAADEAESGWSLNPNPKIAFGVVFHGVYC